MNKEVKKQYGVFRLTQRNYSKNSLFIPATYSEQKMETDFIPASNKTYETLEEAEKDLITYPSPAMYSILPVYFVIDKL